MRLYFILSASITLFSNLREAALKMSIEDKLIEIYSARVEEFIKNPPEKNWNGIIHLKEK